MPSVFDALATLRTPDIQTQCKIGDWIDSLPEDEQDAVAEMFSMEVSDLKLHAALTKIFKVSRELIRQHRRQTCMCFQNLPGA